MSYIYETHMHTKEVSACGQAEAKELVRAYQKLGYTGIIVTDHFFNGNCGVPKELPWEEKVTLFCKGYELAKQEGEKIGLDVFFGFETWISGSEFLIYGLGKEWLLSHPEIMEWSIKEQYENVKKAGGMVIHAHPYRYSSQENPAGLYPEWIDGVEVWNTNNKDPKNNQQAEEYANQYKLPKTCGSDTHSEAMILGGMEMEERLSSIQDFQKIILSGQAKPYFLK